MHATYLPSGGVSTRALLHLVARWFLVSALALTAHTASALAITYTITGSDGTHHLDATFTVNDEAPYNESAEGYRCYFNGDDQRAIMSGSYTIRLLSDGRIIDQGAVGTGASFLYVFPDHTAANYDWLMFYFDAQSGARVNIALAWADKTAFSTFTPPTCFSSQPVNVSSDTDLGSVIYTQAISLATDANIAALRARIAELEAQTAAQQSQLDTAASTIAALNAENADLSQALSSTHAELTAANAQIAALQTEKSALQTENSRLQTQLTTAQQTIAARDITIVGLRNELGATRTQIVALQSNASDAQASLQRMVSAFHLRFHHPAFTLRGTDTNAQLDTLIDGILDLNRGSQQQLYFQLTGKK